MIDIQELLSVLPHRYPILLVDRILEISDDNMRCKGLKNVSINEPFFQGHYPGIPIMPGVLIMESMAQVGAALLMTTPKLVGKIPLIGSIENAKFRRIVRPGDQLIHDVEILWVRGDVGKMKGVATVDGETVAEMEMVFKMSARES
ncbi:MAG: 3-hydroxyacyl-ACP dehydratase FabZ [Armatimonadetes bacterium]|nr:3-hydroxyacyl-ACP dehydratase FabZ [Armatimonadota bacterium]MBS1703714.1 3-hydroxyacyl-ACP dehydratase FabZ [Armatimonadota bacterium]MBS1726085.1 3-hydroxyacyl-ACP dehydratase FabZ [Armatimonadota bacterium]